MNIDPDALTKRWAKLQRNRAIQQAIGEGILSDTEIGTRFGLSASAVSSRRRRMGLSASTRVPRQAKLRRKGHTPQLTEAVVQALVEGHTIEEVGKTIHIPHYTISRMLKELGVEPREIRFQPPPERAYRKGPQRRKQETDA